MQLVELQCFAPVVIWAGLAEKTYIKFDIYDRYEKMSFRNTYTLVGANGPLRLSVPLINGRNQRIPYNMVEIDNSQRWQLLHWRTIISAYNRSPWFEFYQLELKQLFEQQYKTLVEWNSWSSKWLSRQLKWNGTMQISSSKNELLTNPAESFNKVGNSSELQLCHDLRNVFAPKNIRQLLPNAVNYSQVFQDRLDFFPYCSILDLLFCEGPNAKNILKEQARLNEIHWQKSGTHGYLQKD